MIRKVNKVGGNTLTISLPARWVREYGVKHGDEIDLEERSNSLIIRKFRTAKEKSATINIPSKDDFMRRSLLIPYIAGIDKIRVTYSDTAVFILVRDMMNNYLLGFEIVDHGRDYCLMKNMVEGKEADFDTNLRRFFLQIKQMLQELHEAVKRSDMLLIDQMLLMDQTIDKICLYLRRILNTRGYKDESKGKSLYHVVSLLETISDRCRDICIDIKESGFPSSQVLPIIDDLITLFSLFYTQFYRFDISTLSKMKIQEERLKKKILVLMRRGKDAVHLHGLYSILTLLHNLSEEL